MNERFRLNYGRVIVLTTPPGTTSRSFFPFDSGRPSFFKNLLTQKSTSYFCSLRPSNLEGSGYAATEQRGKLDPSIEQIFRGPAERRSISKSTETLGAKLEGTPKRAKRETVKKNEISKNEAKRSLNRDKASSRTGRSSRDLPKLPDYEVPVDQEKSEYADEAEDEAASKDGKYKASEFRVGEDSERYIDQEERSSLYDDFEAKDVVKRGISGAEDYEEADEDVADTAEEAAAEEPNAFEEVSDERKARSDVRVKRDRDNSKEAVAGKMDNADASKDAKAEESLKDKVDGQSNVQEKESSDQTDQKRNVPEKNDNAAAKGAEQETDSKRSANDENAKLENQESQLADGKREAGLSNKANDVASDSSSLKVVSKTDESKVADVPDPGATKSDAPAPVAETAAAEDANKLDSKSNDAVMDADYEKRVEEQIQRKIDSIKEEIKREIAETQRIKEIEENNAKFDELREQEEDDEEAESSEGRESLAKRSVRNMGKTNQVRVDEKRSIRRRKRQGGSGGDCGPEKTQESNTKKSRQARKRSVFTTAARKRESPKEVYLVQTDKKKKRKRRSKNSAPALIPERRNVKLDESVPADFVLDSSFRGENGKSKASEDERAVAEQGKRSGSVASLNDEEVMGPLATEYREAFGGLNSEPGVALARFKRIKRVLGPLASRT
ncbi:silent chromatin protein ESC1-like [Ceratina calcarata]|uniref:Silent chromatin protein ESC1-like n=1 Tax=Ceratina calcarata TaxID=156304 RepID=A0AAJ7S096_9HYME|nr:silent chromatin protein ESC1-like [Ceratina calcarata]